MKHYWVAIITWSKNLKVCIIMSLHDWSTGHLKSFSSKFGKDLSEALLKALNQKKYAKQLNLKSCHNETHKTREQGKQN